MNKKLKCDKKDCNHEWEYSGAREKREAITCPGCQRKLNKIQEVKN